jgi:ubiquinol-cytochrome c reductase cytochrome b subunit
VTQSVPLVGTRLTFLLFGDDVPGDQIIPRFFWLHMVVLPLAMAALLILNRRLHQRIDRRSAYRRAPAQDQTTVHIPVLGAFQVTRETASAVAMFFATAGVLALLGTFTQVSPIWLYGPSRPGATTSGAVPDWYMGFLDGAIRIMPGWEIDVAGHPLTLAVLIPALVVPGAFFTLLAAWPMIERRLTGDRKLHLALDRPRDAVTRTATGAAAITFYGLLWAAAANDQIALHFRLSLYSVTWFFRLAVLVGPVLAYGLTRRICLGLADREWAEDEHGHETGRIVMDSHGGFHEITVPVNDLEDGDHRDRALAG